MAKRDESKNLRAIDLYSGVGGWSLGLRLAGIEVVASYERWGMANETNFKNNRHQTQTIDIRRLSLDDLPRDIDVVVGSPPCTEFSFSNRGGRGDIVDGLEDISIFLKIVDHLKPKFWAMENVPRVTKILLNELKPGGHLERFRHLNVSAHIINMEAFGLPQRRKRCIAGNFDFELLKSYTEATRRRTLGDVISAFSENPVVDPIYGVSLTSSNLRDHVEETPLNEEEARINMAAKTMHPVYNAMAFPDPLNRSVRTVTATCTRVSRESIVIANPDTPNSFRRLTVRERAALQGFPITFQFYGDSYGQKLRMVGNAVPPLFSYYLGHALKLTSVADVPPPSQHAAMLEMPRPPASDARPDKPGSRFLPSRRFRFAIPSLRLKSGVRFELANAVCDSYTKWEVSFYFGTSKSIQSLALDASLSGEVLSNFPASLNAMIQKIIEPLVNFINSADIKNMQRLWSHNGLGRTRPFMLLDKLDEYGALIFGVLNQHEFLCQRLVGEVILDKFGETAYSLPGLSKLARNAPLILGGFIVGSVANEALTRHVRAVDTELLLRASG